MGREIRDKRRLMVATAICAALVVMEAAVLLIVGPEERHRSTPVAVGSSGTTLVPVEEARAPVVLLPEPAPSQVSTTEAPAARLRRTPPASLAITPAAATRPVPETTAPPTTAPPSTTEPPLPACQPNEVLGTIATDKPTYRDDEAIVYTIALENRSGHDCRAPWSASFMYCDGGHVCASAMAVEASPAIEVWPAGAIRSNSETLVPPTGTAEPRHEGTGFVRQTWDLDPANTNSVVVAEATFEIVGSPSSTSTTSTSTTPTTAAP